MEWRKALLNLTGSCENRDWVRVNLTESCLNSINVDLYAFALQPRSIVLYMYVHLAIATKPGHRLQIK